MSCGDRTWDSPFDPSNLLGAPVLLSPADGAVGASSTVTLSWSAVEGATKYWLTVATNPMNLPIDINATSCGGGCTIAANLTGQSHIAVGLTSGTTYYWQVQAFNDQVH